MTKKYKVLIIDDTEDVLDIIFYDIEDERILEEDGLIVEFIIEKLLIEFDEDKRLSDTCLLKLRNISKVKYDYIFSDFTFISDRERNEKLREDLINKRNRGESFPNFQELGVGDFLFTLNNFKARYEESKGSKMFSFFDKYNIQRNFFNHKGEVQVYTNSPEPFDYYFMGVKGKKRKDEIKEVFTKCSNINLFKIHEEFSISESIINGVSKDEYDNFRSSLVGTIIKRLIKEKAFRFMIRSQKTLRFKKLSIALLYLGSIGLIVGLITAVWSSSAHNILQGYKNKTDYSFSEVTVDLGMFLLYIGLIVLIGVGYAKFSEWLLKRRANKELNND